MFDSPYFSLSRVYVEYVFKNYQERTAFMHELLFEQNIEISNHDITDLIVEAVFKQKNNTEIWIIGS
jgi:hypothetical protein